MEFVENLLESYHLILYLDALFDLVRCLKFSLIF